MTSRFIYKKRKRLFCLLRGKQLFQTDIHRINGRVVKIVRKYEKEVWSKDTCMCKFYTVYRYVST